MKGAVLLDAPKAPKLNARDLIVAPRLPAMPRNHTGDPFTSEGDVVLDCDVLGADGKPCGWHAIGARGDVKLALQAHHRLFHSEEMLIIVLNRPSQ